MPKLKDAVKAGLFRLSPALAARCGVKFPLRAPNRQFLERDIFGYLNNRVDDSTAPGRCLFLGVGEYTWHYPRLLKLDFHSLDMDPEQARYGAPGRHLTGSATEMAAFYEPGFFDVVVANGLIGYGLNEQSGYERMLAQCHAVLKPGGLLVLGYNDTPERAPFPVHIDALGLFEPFVPPIAGVTAARHPIRDKFHHVFVFARRRESAAIAA
ncbi:class I SAM-dependent methyltransferase [Achromobacter xylosoxidans]